MLLRYKRTAQWKVLLTFYTSLMKNRIKINCCLRKLVIKWNSCQPNNKNSWAHYSLAPCFLSVSKKLLIKVSKRVLYGNSDTNLHLQSAVGHFLKKQIYCTKIWSPQLKHILWYYILSLNIGLKIIQGERRIQSYGWELARVKMKAEGPCGGISMVWC